MLLAVLKWKMNERADPGGLLLWLLLPDLPPPALFLFSPELVMPNTFLSSFMSWGHYTLLFFRLPSDKVQHELQR